MIELIFNPEQLQQASLAERWDSFWRNLRYLPTRLAMAHLRRRLQVDLRYRFATYHTFLFSLTERRHVNGLTIDQCEQQACVTMNATFGTEFSPRMFVEGV